MKQENDSKSQYAQTGQRPEHEGQKVTNERRKFIHTSRLKHTTQWALKHKVDIVKVMASSQHVKGNRHWHFVTGAVANYRHFVSNERCSFERGRVEACSFGKNNRHFLTAACGFA